MNQLRVISNPDAPEGERGPRKLAPGAPPSPGPVPNELAAHLQFGEAVVWWGSKHTMDLRPALLVAAVMLAILAGLTALAPEFWLQPLSALWKPLAALASPVVLVLVRERINFRSVLVTDTSIVDVPYSGPVDRLAFDNITSVRRDLLRGGLRLDGARHRVQIPPTLMDDARSAIASQLRGRIRQSELDDPLGWLP